MNQIIWLIGYLGVVGEILKIKCSHIKMDITDFKENSLIIISRTKTAAPEFIFIYSFDKKRKMKERKEKRLRERELRKKYDYESIGDDHDN